ncbi:MAG: hypothetical protein ACYDFU_08720 [Nitrospirota bacterium]
MKKTDIWMLIMSLLVIGCLPGLSVALDSGSGGFKALPNQPSGTGSTTYDNNTGIPGGGTTHGVAPGGEGSGGANSSGAGGM